ncbi:MAG: hypothetical protein ACSW8D_09970 [Prevotella sp.]
MMTIKKWGTMLALLMTLALAACDKLEDSDVTSEALVGKWAFSYKTTETLDYELSYKYVVFNADGSCALIYKDGELPGTYRASQAVIRIEANANGEDYTLLWLVLSMSPYQIVTEYTHKLNDEREVTMTVTLDKL